MPGTFSKSNRPARPGAYTNFVGAEPILVPPSAAGIVALAITHDWGPFAQVVSLNSYNDFVSIYGDTTTAGSKAVKMAFRGEDVGGRGGAGGVLCYRMGTGAAAKATRSLNNTGATPAITLTARYEGTRGNGLKVTTQDNAADGSKNDLILYDGTTEVERFTYLDTDITALAKMINANSDWVTANDPPDATGTALALVTSATFSSGNDGTSLTGTEWTNAMSALEVERFGIFAPFDLTDGTILASLKTWAVNLNSKGKRFMVVVGGALDELITAAVSRASSLNDANFVTVGVGSVSDTEFGTLSTSQLSPRIAGVLAARGESESLTFARLSDLTILNGATDANILKAFDAGVIVLSRDSNINAPTRIEKGLTTYTGGDATKPYLIYRQPKYVRTMQSLEMEITEWAETFIIGQAQVSDKTRDAVLGEMKGRLQARVDLGILQPNPTVQIDPDPPPTPQDEFIALLYGIKFGRSVEQVFNTIAVA